MFQLFFLSPEIQSRVRPSHRHLHTAECLGKVWGRGGGKADTGGSFGWISWLSGSTELNLLMTGSFMTCILPACLTSTSTSNLLFLPHNPTAHISHPHRESRLHSHPLAFSPDSQVDFYLMTLPMPFSLCEALLFPFTYLVDSQVFLESKLKHYPHLF